MANHPSSWAVSYRAWDEYFWDEEWVVQASSVGDLEGGDLEGRPQHITAQFKPLVLEPA
jgi:hypothetical protein